MNELGGKNTCKGTKQDPFIRLLTVNLETEILRSNFFRFHYDKEVAVYSSNVSHDFYA
jgi:hypothetical protein